MATIEASISELQASSIGAEQVDQVQGQISALQNELRYHVQNELSRDITKGRIEILAKSIGVTGVKGLEHPLPEYDIATAYKALGTQFDHPHILNEVI